LACSQSGDHPEKAKFGYMLDMKVEKKKKKTVFMMSCGYLLEVIIKF
jgi:hypothetical protein